MKKSTNISSNIFMIIGVIFLLYGVYTVITSFNYVTTYTTSATISIMGSIQYVINAAVSFFGFGALFIGVSLIIKKLNAILEVGVKSIPTEDNTPAKEPEVVPAPVAAETPEPAKETRIISDPLAMPGDDLPVIEVKAEEAEKPKEPEETEEMAQTPMTLEEPPVVDEETEPEFEVEYIYADEPDVSETKAELDKIINELEEIKIEEISKETEEVKPEPIRITSDFIKDLFESK